MVKSIIADVLPPELRKKPAFFEVNEDDYASAIEEALENTQEFAIEDYRKIVSSPDVLPELINSTNALSRFEGHLE